VTYRDLIFDRHLTDTSLPDASSFDLCVEKVDDTMKIALKEDSVGVTLTFDGWTNVKNEQLLGAVLISSEGRSYVWKAVDISIERENHINVMGKIESMLTELKQKEINVCAIVTDSAGAYAAAR